jgi:phosphoribosylformylglycinamidine synthase
VMQVRRSERDALAMLLRDAGWGHATHVIGHLNDRHELRVVVNGTNILAEPCTDLRRAWSATTHQMQRLRDNPVCADEEFARIGDLADPGLSVKLSYDMNADVAAPFINTGVRPRVAVLREQGVNSQAELACAFDKAGFDAFDVHMTDILAGRVSLAEFKGVAAAGGFSYGDVLGAGEGWSKSILFNARARDEFEAFFKRSDTFALGVCNGCQMMSNLKEIIPGANNWPHFGRNLSEQYEARLVMVEVMESPSIFFKGMEGSRLPIVTAHGEGRATFANRSAEEACRWLTALRFTDNRGAPTQTYPYNPNGSTAGVTSVTTPDGRFTVLMPHPERTFRGVLFSWHPDGWADESPWMRMFRNARVWVG